MLSHMKSRGVISWISPYRTQAHSIIRTLCKSHITSLRRRQYRTGSIRTKLSPIYSNNAYTFASTHYLYSSNLQSSLFIPRQHPSCNAIRSYSSPISRNIDPIVPPDTQSPKLKSNDQKLNPTAPGIKQNWYTGLKSHIKWILIRNKERPFSKNELGTLFSWLILSQIVWMILKTTTFVSLLLLAFNTIFAKELVGETIGNLLNYFIDNIDIKFQDALIPEWKSGLIRFNNVELKTDKNQPNNQFAFDLQFQQIEMNFSLRKWLSGCGLINDVKIYGMNGTSHIIYSSPTDSIEYTRVSIKSSDTLVGQSNGADKLLINWFSNPYYQLGSIAISNSNITVCESYQDQSPGTTYKISIFNLEIPKLRFNQMLTDFLNASVISGSINNSLFTFHKRQQKIGYSNNNMANNIGNWKRITRLRVNSISVKDLGIYKTNSFNWIRDGNIDIIADIMLPFEDEENGTIKNLTESNEEKYIVIDLKFVFKDLKAVLPSNPPKLSTGENIVTLDELKPVVSYVNLQRALTQFQNMSNNEDDKISAHTILFRDSPEISIRRRKSYPNMNTIRAKTNSKNKHYRTPNNVKGAQSGTVETPTLPETNLVQPLNTSIPTNNELALRARVVRNIKSLENRILFQETGIYDQLSMELYVDLLKIVEEWEYKNKDEWLRKWGNGLASQLLLFGFTSPV